MEYDLFIVTYDVKPVSFLVQRVLQLTAEEEFWNPQAAQVILSTIYMVGNGFIKIVGLMWDPSEDCRIGNCEHKLWQ